MTPHPARTILGHSAASHRFRAALSALTLGLGLSAAATPAAAECAGPDLTVNRAHAVDYVCRVRCAATGGDARLLIIRDRDGHDATACMNLCDSWVGCSAISFEFITETGSDGRVYQYTQCSLWGEGELATASRPGDPNPRARQNGVCHRRWAPLRDPSLRIDTNRFQPDQYRPGVPGPGVPFSKKRP